MTGYDDGLPYPDPDGDLVDIRITALEARVRDLKASLDMVLECVEHQSQAFEIMAILRGWR